MPRKNATPPENTLLLVDLSQALCAAQDDLNPSDFDDVDAVYAAMEFSKQLLSYAHDLAQQAIQIRGYETEADRIAAARRQVLLIEDLFEQLQAVKMGTQS